MHPILVFLMSFLIWPANADAAKARWPGPFPVEVLSARDGDTVEVRFVDGPCGRAPCPGQETLVRILGIDAPEVHRCGQSRAGQRASGGQSCASCDAEWQLGKQALAELERLLKGRAARVGQISPDKYAGRVLGALEVFADGGWRSAADHLRQKGLAVSYDGGRKTKPWCRAEARR
jgi:endonuclease YncB( thermonuclease family)